MATEEVNTVNLDTKSADKVVYGIKFPWDKTTDPIKMLGVQAATSTTNTRKMTDVATKKGTLHASGSRSETFVVDSYWLRGSDIYDGLKRVVEEGIKVAIWRIDFNEKRYDSTGKLYVPADFAMATPNGLPNTEAVNNLIHSNITYDIDGSSQPGMLSQDELDPDMLSDGLKMFSFTGAAGIGGTEDPEPTPLEQWDKEHGTSDNNISQSSSSTGTTSGSNNSAVVTPKA